MVLEFGLISVFVLLSAVILWARYVWRRTRSLPGFETLLDHLEVSDGLTDFVAGRALVKGEFRGRKVAIIVEQSDEESTLIVTMETRAAPTMDTYDFAGYKADREGDRAVFALEVKHGLRLRHMDGSLKAEGQPHRLFPRTFDRPKWQSVLEAMDTLCGSIERRVSI
jgi:hypothetical protein